ncbi:hypothetical protein CCHL11_00064 [Colletotrichum chlorophyti]|uniref:Condensation domain-containing protein n=1 Tax=Colletotrichum chlorophyti TaxID=708187 RepID=A0A1Q8RUD0_9PEZI|nr:hypothetical protein CCHL11_00064 [Colletotrichum chlorophyti]
MVFHPDAALRMPFKDINIEAVPLGLYDFHTYPLAVDFFPVGESLTVDVKFDSDRIDSEIFNIMMNHFDQVLQGISNASATADIASVTKISPRDISSITA